MSEFVESLRRLHKDAKISTQKLVALRTGGKISQEEYDCITAE